MSTFAGPFFLLGVQRSGTTLLRMLLDSHSKIAIPFESMVLIEFYHRIHLYNNLENVDDRTRLVKDLISARGISDWDPKIKIEDIDIYKCNTYASIINEIFRSYMLKCGKYIWGDKTPSYTQDFHILNELFPSAKFIHLIRDGRDVALSIVQQPWGPVTFAEAFEYWAETVKCSRKMGKLLSKDKYLEVKFEDLVSKPKENICKILEFLSLDYEAEMLSYGSPAILNKLPASSIKFHGNLQKPIDTSLAFKWMRNLSKIDQALSFQISGDLFKELGYPSGNIKAPNLLITMRKIHFFVTRAIDWRLKKIRALITLSPRNGTTMDE